MKRSIYGVIFDLNGVLVDSEWMHNKAGDEAICSFGIDIDQDKLSSTYGMPTKERSSIILGNLIDAELVKIKKDYYMYRLIQKNITPIGKITNMLKFLCVNYKIAVATDCDSKTARLLIEGLQVNKYISAVVTRDSHGCFTKPHPSLYVLAANRLHIGVNNCVAFDDSDAGIIAATNAGCRAFKVEHNQISKDRIESFLDSIHNGAL